MTTLTISLSDSLTTFIEDQIATKGFGNVSDYVRSLLREAQAKEHQARLEDLLLQGLASSSLPIDAAARERLQVPGGARPLVRLVIQDAAERDIRAQAESYAGNGLLPIARRFGTAVGAAIDAIMAAPSGGTPRASVDPGLAGLCSWPIKGFADLKVYCLADPAEVTIIRVLHDKRDIGIVLDSGLY